MNDKICVFYLEDDITLFHTLYPLLTSKKHRKRFYFTNDLDYVLNRSDHNTLILFRFFKRRDIAKDTELWSRLRDKFKTICYFDDVSSADDINTVAFPYVDLYLKKQIHRDRSTYLEPSYGKRAFSHYYHNKYDVWDEPEDIRPPVSDEDIKKIRPAWNLGIGCFPKRPKRNGIARRIHPLGGIKAIPLLYNDTLNYKSSIPGIPKISARYGMKFDRNTVAKHRAIYEETVKGNDIFLTGRVPLKEYNRELTTVQATFSPFGWGEVCFRDFEAVINRSALIKPDMDHLETWPNIYRSNETYLSVDWDGNNLLEKSRNLLESPQKRQAMAENALTVYHDAFIRLEEKLEEVLEGVL